jgi:deoxyribonuclease V
MASPIDFYEDLLHVIEQIPRGKISTYIKIAKALGDPVAAKAVKKALERERFSEFRTRVVESAPHGSGYFDDFVSERPLEQLARYQIEQAELVIRGDDLHNSDRVAGFDVSYQGDVAASACVVMDSDLEVIDSASTVIPVSFPYIPGYLMFREAPAIEAIAEHVTGFDVLMVNGHGIAHPRGCGLASYVGLKLDQPTIGVARTLLVGEKREMGHSVIHDGEVIAAEISRPGHAPFYVSTGHRISLTSCIEIVRRMAWAGQLPEPLRLAHIEAGRLMREI